MNGIEKISKICILVKDLTDEDFAEIKKMADEQIGFIHPLKHKKQADLNDTGLHNLKVLAALQNLKDVIKSR